MKNEKRKVKDKIRDSLLIFCDITEQTISQTRLSADFILVYDSEKNPLPNQITRETKQNSPSFEKIGKYFMQKGGGEMILFGLEKFKKLYFKEVHTYSKDEFDKYLSNNVF